MFISNLDPNSYNVTVVILTLNAELYIDKLLSKLKFDEYNVIVVDSKSDDRTLLIAENYDCKIHSIDRKEFNHGNTREVSRNLINSDITVFLTQDAIPKDDSLIEKLIEPIIDGSSDVSYGRQLPRRGAGLIEAFQREFNYDENSLIKSKLSLEEHGVFTFFCSNSCAAWKNDALDLIGGFKPTLTNEDYITCAELVLNGFKVSYVPNAMVYHSHDYSLWQEFKRMFDTGYVRAERPWLDIESGTATKRGFQFSKKLFSMLAKNNPFLIPYAIFQVVVKFIGFKIGNNALRFPKSIKKILSEQSYYWDSKYYLKK